MPGVERAFWVIVVVLMASACGSDPAPGPSSVEPLSGPLRLTRVASLGGEVTVAARPHDSTLYVGTLEGQVRRIRTDVPDGEGELEEPALDLRERVSTGEGEQGLLDIDFSPDGTAMVVSFTDLDGALVVAAIPADSWPADPNDLQTIIEIPQRANTHNGGDLEFGPDGHLWIGVGDGGSNGFATFAASLSEAQDPGSLDGTLLRITADLLDGGYDVPADNPFVDTDEGGRPEVWLYGLRNPYRFSFDADGTLWLPDVGVDTAEEINRLPPPDRGAGANLGWGLWEGSAPFVHLEAGIAGDAPEPVGHVRPWYEYTHDDGRCAVVGGAAYDDDAHPTLGGAYVFGDFCDPTLRALRATATGAEVTKLEVDTDGDGPSSISSVRLIGTSLYVTDLIGGGVFRLDGR